MVKKYRNTKKESFLKNLPQISLENEEDLLTLRCKFNFSYMDLTQSAGQKFSDLTTVDLLKLLDKIRNYCKEPLEYWTKQIVGRKSGKVLEIYPKFPLNSDFTHPPNVPLEVEWGRFRLDNHARLVGFIIPERYAGKHHIKTNCCFDCNTFYVVFIDRDHKFYKIS